MHFAFLPLPPITKSYLFEALCEAAVRLTVCIKPPSSPPFPNLFGTPARRQMLSDLSG